eukprot:GFYU01035654.1.p1 GENE.GFYU01035654.1~~GFYU01035654.1.p1  ORF type:complete len:149 (-),score=17.07 GFYU01035654.1:6-452(-)
MDATAAVLSTQEVTPQRLYTEAAEAIRDADFLLVAAGAGFSADSGLPVYADVATQSVYKELDVNYQDLCDPHLLEVNAPLFYGFWLDCMDRYRDTQPHAGYSILARWRRELFRGEVKRADRARAEGLHLKHQQWMQQWTPDEDAGIRD